MQFSIEAAGREGGTGDVLYPNVHARGAVLPQVDLGGREGGREERKEEQVTLVVSPTVCK